MVKLIKSHNKGFTLLELLLAISVFASLLAIVSVVFNNWFKDNIDYRVSREMQQLQTASRDFVKLNLDSIILNQIPAVGSVSEILVANMVSQGFLPAGYNARNSYRQNLRVFIRYLSNNTVNGDVVEVITFSYGPPIEDKRLFKAASNGEESVGLISGLVINGTCCNGNAQSVSSSWSIPLNAGYLGATPLPLPNANGGYMAAYDMVSSDNSLSSDYLYRNRINGSPQLNRMETNLNINNNDITNAGVIVSDSMQISGNGVFSGTETNGSRSPYVLSVRDNFETLQNVNVTSVADQTKGNVIINGDNNIGVDFTVSGTMNVLLDDGASGGGNLSSNSSNTTNLSVTGVSRFGNLDNNNNALGLTNIYADDIDFRNSVTTNNLQAAGTSFIDQVTTDSAVSGSTIISGGGGLTVNSDLQVDKNVVIVGTSNGGQVNSDNETDIRNLVSCGNGCPP